MKHIMPTMNKGLRKLIHKNMIQLPSMNIIHLKNVVNVIMI